MNGDEFAPAEFELPPDMNLDDYLSGGTFSLPLEDPFSDPSPVGWGWFVADFEGECSYGDPVKPGDVIRKTDEPDEFEHKQCVDDEITLWGDTYS
jgi:hypothetical protein